MCAIVAVAVAASSWMGLVVLVPSLVLIVRPIRLWISSAGLPLDRIPPKVRVAASVAGLVLAAVISAAVQVRDEDERAISAFKRDPSVLSAEVDRLVSIGDRTMATVKVDSLLKAHPSEPGLRDLRQKVLMAELSALRESGQEHMMRYHVDRFRKTVPDAVNPESLEDAVGEVVISGVDRLAAAGNFDSAARLIGDMADLYPSHALPRELGGMLKEVKAAYREEQLRSEERRRAQERVASQRAIMMPSVKEDPRNIYIYCIAGSFSCFTTPAECQDQMRYHSNASCSPVACGTADAVANTSTCARKGYR